METKLKVSIGIVIMLVVYAVVLIAKMDTLYERIEFTEVQLEKERNHIEMLYDKINHKEIEKRVEIAGKAYSIDPQLLEAIERLETGHYTSEIYLKNNNTWGAFYKGEYMKFDSELQSTLELARTLRYNYFDKGLNTLEKIGKVYCPSDENWAQKVRQVYERLGE